MTTDQVVTPEFAARLCAELTDVERKTLVLVMQGYSTKEIADLICRAIKTVEATRVRAMEKLGARNMVHAAVIGVKAGLL